MVTDVFTAIRGYDHVRSWTRTTGTRTLSDLVVEIRSGSIRTAGETSLLVASSVADRQSETVAAIDVSDTDLVSAPNVIAYSIDRVEMEKIPVSSVYVIEFRARVDGGLEEQIGRHPFVVSPQASVRVS